MYEIFNDLMDKNGLSISETARQIGMSPSTITDWKAGRTMPKADKLLKIAEFFDVSVEYLLTGKDRQRSDYFYANPMEQDIILAFRKSEHQQAILALLGIDESEYQKKTTKLHA